MNHCLFAALLIIVQNDEFAVIAARCELILDTVRQVERCDLIAGEQPAGLHDDRRKHGHGYLGVADRRCDYALLHRRIFNHGDQV